MTETREFGAVWTLTVIMQDKFWSSSEETRGRLEQAEAYKTDKPKLTDKATMITVFLSAAKKSNKQTRKHAEFLRPVICVFIIPWYQHEETKSTRVSVV